MSSELHLSPPPLPGAGWGEGEIPTSDTDSIAIRVDNLSKCYHIYERPRDRLLQMLARGRRQYYREFWALKDVSFEVKKGETVGIIGHNGSGKSTLLQMVCGTLNPTSGSIRTHGRIAALLELGSGFNPEFTGRENVYLNAAVLGLSKGEIDARFADIAAFADIGEFIEQPVKTYSSGMMVRLAFSAAINVDPEILVVDEALSVGDELFQRKCFSRLEAIRARGSTILFVSHSGSQIVELCDRAILLDGGEKLAIGHPKATVGKYQKLIYAPHDKRAAIRDEIRRSGSDVLAGGEAAMDLETCVDISRGNQRGEPVDSDEYFDPHLKPLSTLGYESKGALISAPQILTLLGEPVNCLKRRKVYRYVYQVRFDRAATNVRFAMVIKTAAGLELGGAVSAPKPDMGIRYLADGSVVKVEFRFACNLNPGTYFLNAGVIGNYEGVDTYLNRVLDLCVFRVSPVIDNISTAVIDFYCEPKILVDQNRP